MRRGCFVPTAHAQSQLVVVVGHITQWGNNMVKYIERDHERDGQSPTLYGSLSREQFFDHSASRYFSWVVSPEHGHQLDLTGYTQQFMERVSRDLGIDMAWVAADHFNTEHPHTHIVIAGKDMHGKNFEIDNEYLRNGVKNQARELATRELGPQHNYDWNFDRNYERTLEREWTREIIQLQERVQEYERSYTHTIEQTRGYGRPFEREDMDRGWSR